jgi:hypothetical protein
VARHPVVVVNHPVVVNRPAVGPLVKRRRNRGAKGCEGRLQSMRGMAGNRGVFIVTEAG